MTLCQYRTCLAGGGGLLWLVTIITQMDDDLITLDVALLFVSIVVLVITVLTWK